MRLEPHKLVVEHEGPLKAVTAYIQGLNVPKMPDGRPSGIVKITGKDYPIGEGESLQFDDTYKHSYRNESDEPATYLMLAVERPDMPADMKLFTNYFVLPLVHTIMTVRHPDFSLKNS